jgi:hypothetical protein
MKKASLKLQPVGYQVYRAISQLNRQFEDQVENLDHLMSFRILPPAQLRAYQVMLEEIRALINQDFHEVLGEREFHNSAYYEHQRLTYERRTSKSQKLSGKKGHKASRQGQAVRP